MESALVEPLAQAPKNMQTYCKDRATQTNRVGQDDNLGSRPQSVLVSTFTSF